MNSVHLGIFEGRADRLRPQLSKLGLAPLYLAPGPNMRYFTEVRTGHGLGLEVHEETYIQEGYELQLEKGMVFTVEPSLYVLGQFGIQVEDAITVNDVPTLLSSFPKDIYSVAI